MTIRSWLVVATAVLVGGVACGDETIVEEAPTGAVVVSFDEVAAGADLELNQLVYTNAAGNLYSVSKLKYVVSDIVLRRTDGTVHGLGGIHYRNHAEPDTRSVTITGVPGGTYDAIVFTFGLDEQKNRTGAYPELETPEVNMAWPPAMGEGYHYMKLEGNFVDSLANTRGYTTHTGARKLASDEFTHHHYFRVACDVGPAVIDGDSWRATVEFDINNWYGTSDPDDGFPAYDFNALASQMIMGNLEAQAILRANGPSCFSATISRSP